MYYATYVKNAGYDVKIFDMRSENNSIDIITRMQEIEESDFYFFWIFKTGDAKEIYSISTYLKKNFLNVLQQQVAHVDMCQDETKDYFDSILFGPGESNFINIIKDAKQNILKKLY